MVYFPSCFRWFDLIWSDLNYSCGMYFLIMVLHIALIVRMVQRLILTTTILWLKHKNLPSCYNSCICRSSTEIHTFLWIRQKHCHHRKCPVFFIKKIFMVQIIFARSFTDSICRLDPARNIASWIILIFEWAEALTIVFSENPNGF